LSWPADPYRRSAAGTCETPRNTAAGFDRCGYGESGQDPGRDRTEAGIELVAKEREDGLWAVQIKAYVASHAIKNADVDSFLSESSRPRFSYRPLIATTDRLGPTARRTLDAQREPVGYQLRSQLNWRKWYAAEGFSVGTLRQTRTAS
jgi:predicted helicase